MGILRVGVRQLVDRWKLSGGCCWLSWYLLKYLLVVGKWPLLSEVSQVTWATNKRTNGGLRKMNASVSGTLVSWISESPSERHLPRWRQMDQWSMTSRSSCGLDLVGQNSRNVVATNCQVLQCYRCHGSFIQPKEQVQEGECDVSQGKFVNSSLKSS